MSEADERAAVVAEARAWLRTAYHHLACVKGVGVDCAMFLRAVYENAGLIERVEVKPYSPQWYMHRSEELYLAAVQERSIEITEAEAQPGDVVVYKFGRCFAHGAIIVDPGWPTIIHAFKDAGCVVLGEGNDGRLKDRDRRFFKLRRWGA